MQLRVRPVRALADNYIWLIESPRAPSQVVVVDPGDAAPVIAELERRGASLAAILLTHHHPDHIAGVPALLALARVPVIGPADGRIPFLTRSLADAERLELGDLGLAFESLHVPGHTLTHLAFCGHGALFCGDTLFSAGCGRLFEGTALQMNASLNRLRGLPPDTRIYCGHEYTEANLRFALAVEPHNRATLDYREALVERDQIDQRFGERGFTGARSAAEQNVFTLSNGLDQEVSDGLRQRLRLDQLGKAEPVRPKLADR